MLSIKKVIILATIYLSLSKKRNTLQQQEVLIRFSHGKINLRAKSNIFILAEHWNDKDQQISVPNFRLMTDERTELKQYLTCQSEKLNNLTADIHKKFNEADKTKIPKDWLVDIIDRFSFPEKYLSKEETLEITTLFQFTQKFIVTAHLRKDKSTGRLLSPNNIEQYKATEKHLKDFAITQGKQDFTFDDIDKVFYDKFVTFLQNNSFTQNTVGKHIRILKLMLNEATQEGCNTNTTYNSFHVFTEDVDSVYLTEQELQQLKDVDLSQMPHLDRVRDYFLLLAWTGSRISDLGKITPDDIKDNFISFRQQKTKTKVVIPLHPVVLGVLEKYNYNLPKKISNQRFNEYIKQACQTAGIDSYETITRTVGGQLVTERFEKWEKVSSHTGRRSFCTNMYKRGLPTLMIMSISGHKTEKSFLKYIKVSAEEHAEMMAEEWKKIYNTHDGVKS